MGVCLLFVFGPYVRGSLSLLGEVDVEVAAGVGDVDGMGVGEDGAETTRNSFIMEGLTAFSAKTHE